MKRNTIRLTEGQLMGIIKESVRSIMRESYFFDGQDTEERTFEVFFNRCTGEVSFDGDPDDGCTEPVEVTARIRRSVSGSGPDAESSSELEDYDFDRSGMSRGEQRRLDDFLSSYLSDPDNLYSI